MTDVLLGAGIALGVAVVIAADWQGRAPQSLWAYLFALGFGLAMIGRRYAPRMLLALTVLGIFAYYALDYPPIGIALPAVAALYSCAEQRHTAAAMVGGGVLTVVSGYFRLRDGLPTTYLASYELITNLALIAAAIALGVSVRLRREGHQQAARIADLTAESAVRQEREQAQAERVQLARDLHDVIGHTLSVVSVHANVAGEAIGSDDDAARRAIEQIRAATTPAMSELRGTVRLLRSDAEPAAPSPGLAGLEDLARSVREAGIAVEMAREVPGGVLSAPIEAAAYRIAQESLTNVIRHSRATLVQVRIGVQGEWLSIDIADDGVGGPGQAGHGIAGMRERARLLGGSLSAGPRGGRGYSVRAELPLRIGS